jgi:hypothetical protein
MDGERQPPTVPVDDEGGQAAGDAIQSTQADDHSTTGTKAESAKRQRTRAIGLLVLLVAGAWLVATLIDPHPPTSDPNSDLKDFYNDVVALCTVVIFAKFVAHGRRANEHGSKWTILHGACIVFAAVGIVAALRGAEGGKPGLWYDLAWIGASMSMGILVIDVLWFDLRPLVERR